MTTTTSAVEEATRYLQSSAGQHLVRAALRRRGLPLHLADDIVAEVLVAAVHVDRRGEAIENHEAFVVATVQRRVKDQLRGRRRHPEVLVDPLDDPAEAWSDDGVRGDPGDVVVAADDLRGVREALAVDLGRNRHAAAGALGRLLLALDGALPAEDCPQPTAGAGAGNAEALAWAAIFYSGLEGCFPSPGAPDDAAVRQRRSRAARAIQASLTRAAAAAGLAEGATGG